uniref:Uncharacterized protein n=1 Tax=Arundo donax TaxID=35708 RepID=A0A0A8YU07_ARUDO
MPARRPIWTVAGVRTDVRWWLTEQAGGAILYLANEVNIL